MALKRDVPIVTEAVRAALEKAEYIRQRRKDFKLVVPSEEDQVHLMVLASIVRDCYRRRPA